MHAKNLVWGLLGFFVISGVGFGKNCPRLLAYTMANPAAFSLTQKTPSKPDFFGERREVTRRVSAVGREQAKLLGIDPSKVNGTVEHASFVADNFRTSYSYDHGSTVTIEIPWNT